MTVLTLPSNLDVMRVDWGQRRFDLRFDSGDAGTGQTRILAPARWTAGLVCPDQLSQAAAAVWRDLILRLQGRINQLALYDLGNPAPRGTMRGTLTLSTAAAVGDVALAISGGAGQAGTTLLAGDLLGVGSLLLQVGADCTANGSGVVTVPIVNRLRTAQSSGASVTWDKPTAEFRLATHSGVHYGPRSVSATSFDFVEKI